MERALIIGVVVGVVIMTAGWVVKLGGEAEHREQLRADYEACVADEVERLESGRVRFESQELLERFAKNRCG